MPAACMECGGLLTDGRGHLSDCRFYKGASQKKAKGAGDS